MNEPADLPTPPAVPPATPMPAEVPSPAAASRGRWRLLALAILAAFWIAPWAQMQAADGGTFYERWSARTGAAAGLALLALWGLAAATLAAGTRRGIRIGAAWTDAAVALAATALLLLGHRWIPGGEIREAWVPIFGPLAILGALDAIVLVRQPDAGPEVGVIRAAAALFAAAALAVDGAWIPAAVAAWLGLSPLWILRATGLRSARRRVEALMLLACAVALVSPLVQEALVGVSVPVVELVATRYGWTLAGLAVAALAVVGLLRPEPPEGLRPEAPEGTARPAASA